MATADGFTRRDFLAAAGAAPLGLGLRQPSARVPEITDVVVIGGDPAAYAAVFRLAQDPAVRVVLVEEDLPWAAMTAPAADVAVADLPPFVRGHQACFDSWRDRGNPGWGFADVLPAFKRIETYEGGASETRGGDGPLSVTHCWDPHAGHRAFLMAAGPAGFRQDSRHDFNGPRSQSVVGYYQKAIAADQPHTLTAAFLAPVRDRPAVSVAAGGHASRLLIERGRAVGVEYVIGRARHVVRAERSLILAAGPARAAQLLMLSGIGPADRLRALGIPLVADRQGVGGNLHDQLRLALRYAALQELPASTVSAGMFTVSLSASPPDLQMDLVTPRAGGPPELGLDVTLVRPSSRGALTLASADPTAAPRLSLNPLATDGDLTALVQGLRLGRLLMTGSSLDRFRAAETPATAAAQAAADLPGLVRAMATACGHLAGTCAMGPASDRAAVVDATLAVHGVAGLRVAGAAMMPDVVNAPPEAAALMIGDRAATFVLQNA